MLSLQSIPFFLPFSDTPWGLDRGIRSPNPSTFVHRTPKWQRYAQSYLERTNDGRAIIHQERPFIGLCCCRQSYLLVPPISYFQSDRQNTFRSNHPGVSQPSLSRHTSHRRGISRSSADWICMPSAF